MPRKSLVLMSLLALLLSGCPKRTTRNLTEYQLAPADAYLGGDVVELYEHQVLNRRDFVYSLAFDPTSRWLAFSHMVSTDFELSLAGVEDGQVGWKVPLNSTEHDVEAVGFVGDAAVVVASRRNASAQHPTLRRFAVAGGAEQARAYSDDEWGLVQLDVDPGRGLIAAVTAKDGNLVLFDAETLAWRGEIRAHRGPATAVVFAPDGTLYTGGQDHSVAVWRLVPMASQSAGNAVAARLEIGDARQQALALRIDERRTAIAATPGELQPTAITSGLATRVGLSAEPRTRTVQVGAGTIEAPLVTLPTLGVQALDTGPVEAVICDQCVPVGCDLVLGSELAGRFEVQPGSAAHLLAVAVQPLGGASPTASHHAAVSGSAGDDARAQLLRPELQRRFELPGVVNDLRVASDGTRLVAALSSEPAVRTLPLYEREKAGKYPEPGPANAAVLVDAASGAVLRSFVGHRGYVVSADLSPDGRTLVSGGWDNHVRLFDVATGAQRVDHTMAWLLRRVRFSADGRTLGVAAWTPPSAAAGGSEPAAVLFDLVYASPVKQPR